MSVEGRAFHVKGGIVLVKRIILLLASFFLLLGNSQAMAAPTITGITTGVTPDNQLRVVLDCDQPTKARANLRDDELVVTVTGVLKNGVNKSYSIASSETVRKITVEEVGNRVILHLPLKKQLNSSQYKLFNLKKDRGARRPDRVVLDVYNGPKRNIAVSGNNTATTAPPRVRSFAVQGGIKGKRITLDAGHGGSDSGAIGANGLMEKDVTLPVTLKLKELLEKKGAIVSLTRRDDRDVYGPDATDRQELQARVDVAERNVADLFISIHCNANNNREIGGFSTYYHAKSKYDLQVATTLQEAMMKTGKFRDLGVRHANLYVNKRSSMPGALVEMLFLSNKREEKILRSNWFRNKLANALAEGIENFYQQN